MRYRSPYLEQEHLKGYPWLFEEIKVFDQCKNKILDVGCGTGWFCTNLKKSYPTVDIFGIDTRDIWVENATFNYVKGSCYKIPFKNQIFDGCACKAVIEHLHDPLSAIQEINRVLKVGGILFIPVPDVNDPHFWDDYSHVRPYTKKSLSCLLEEGGFQVNEIYYLSSLMGAGIILRLFNCQSHAMLRFLGELGIFRSSVSAVAIKR